MKTIITLSAFCMCFAVSGFSQSRKPYVTSGGELIFSFSDLEQNGATQTSLVRFAPVVNLQAMVNFDLGNSFGIFSGLAVRNVGYIYEDYIDPSDDLAYKKKFRSYNVGVPLGIKFGNLDRFFFYGGYEAELAVHYKEKTFEGGDKTDKIQGWFSDRQELFQHGFLVGIQFPYGANLKFKYYLSEFHNKDYTASSGVKPYETLKSNIYYFSLSFFLFRNMDVYLYNADVSE